MNLHMNDVDSVDYVHLIHVLKSSHIKVCIIIQLIRYVG